MLLVTVMAQAHLQDEYLRSLPHSASHANELASIMSRLHRETLLRFSDGETEVIVRWDQPLLNVRVFEVDSNGRVSEISLQRSYADRPSFEWDQHVGWFDIMPTGDSYAGFLMLDDTWFETPDIEQEPEMLVAQQCSCGGTGSTPGCNVDTDCFDQQPCTLPNNVASSCQWSNQRRRPGPCGSLDTFTLGGLGNGVLLPLMFAKARRRRCRRQR